MNHCLTVDRALTPAAYAVFGNPIGHSKSPLIHAQFAAQTGQLMTYHAQLAPLNGFSAAVRDFFVDGGSGCNVTLPFKQEAFGLADIKTPRALCAGAVNTLWMQDGVIHADNTDGAGLVRDLQDFVSDLHDCRILILGAGGAVRGIVKPLLDAGAHLILSNRNAARLELLISELRVYLGQKSVQAPFEKTADSLTVLPWSDVEGGTLKASFDVVMNATSAGMGQAPMGQISIGSAMFAPDLFRDIPRAYDLQYLAGVTPFCAAANAAGVATRDGLGMLVAQAAEAFYLWRGIMPDTAPVMTALRKLLS